jgi:hypothetical protein
MFVIRSLIPGICVEDKGIALVYGLLHCIPAYKALTLQFIAVIDKDFLNLGFNISLERPFEIRVNKTLANTIPNIIRYPVSFHF